MFGIDLHMPCQIGHDKQQIAKFLMGVFGGFGLDQFFHFLAHLVQNFCRRWPVKPHTRRTFLQLYRTCQGGQAQGNPVQSAGLGGICTLGCFYRLPIFCLLLHRFIARLIAKHMRMSRNHFIANPIGDGCKCEMAQFFANCGLINGLQQQVAQFALQIRNIPSINGIGHLVGLLNRVGRDGFKGLFNVPGATGFGVSQAAHNVQQAFNPTIGGMHQIIFVHCLAPFFGFVFLQRFRGESMPVVNRIADFAEDMKTWRRHLHQNPELGFDCHQTADFVVDRLRDFGVDDIHEGIAKTGVVALIHGQKPGGVIGLRADMDALPIEEATGAGYASRTPGKMHACGHDGHTTMLLGAARYLAETRNFAGTVALIFQPAEENGGGGGVMVDEGMIDRFKIDQVYALHTEPGAPVGQLGTIPGPIMAAVDDFAITVTGQGGHGALPHRAVDPIPAAVAIVQAFQTIVSRNHDSVQDLVVSVTQIHCGTADNVIEDIATLGGTVRTFMPDVQDMVERRMGEICAGIAVTYNVSVNLTYTRGYPATINSEKETAFATDVAREICGDAMVNPNRPREMGAEDFSYMLQQRPGSYLFLGQGDGAEWHNPAFDFNDDVSPVGASFFARLVERAQPLEA